MTPSGISTTVSAGLETPDMIELRKRKNQIESDMESMGGETPALYKILPEKATSVGASMMGSSKVYDISAAKKANLLHEAMMGGTASGIDMTLNPDELEMDSETLQSRFDQQVKQTGADNEDMSEADLAKQKQKKKPKPATTPASGTSSSADKDKNKKYKEFKF
jgi:splicing factor 3B subunit 2